MSHHYLRNIPNFLDAALSFIQIRMPRLRYTKFILRSKPVRPTFFRFRGPPPGYHCPRPVQVATFG